VAIRDPPRASCARAAASASRAASSPPRRRARIAAAVSAAITQWQVVAAYVTSNVRLLRAEAGWTQAETAERAGIDAKHIQAIEAGSGNVTLRTLVALASAFGVDPRRLLEPAPLAVRRARGRPPAVKATKG